MRAADVICPGYAASEKWNPLSTEIRTGEVAYCVSTAISSTVNEPCCYSISLIVMQPDGRPEKLPTGATESNVNSGSFIFK